MVTRGAQILEDDAQVVTNSVPVLGLEAREASFDTLGMHLSEQLQDAANGISVVPCLVSGVSKHLRVGLCEEIVGLN